MKLQLVTSHKIEGKTPLGVQRLLNVCAKLKDGVVLDVFSLAERSGLKVSTVKTIIYYPQLKPFSCLIGHKKYYANQATIKYLKETNQ